MDSNDRRDLPPPPQPQPSVRPIPYPIAAPLVRRPTYSYSVLYSQNPTLYPNPNHPSLISPIESVSSLSYPHFGGSASVGRSEVSPFAHVSPYGLCTDAQKYCVYGHPAVASSIMPAYYNDPNRPDLEAVRIHGANPPVVYAAGIASLPNGIQQPVAVNSNPTIQAPRHHNRQQAQTERGKPVQPARCEVCKIVCDTQDVLQQHRLGKKHKKNLEKLKAVVAGVPAASALPTENGKSVEGQPEKKKAAEHVEDLEAKRRKVEEGGAAADAIKTCELCNVVCNSETVHNYHLLGKKHAAMVRKHAAGTQSAAAT
ncbi:hypothetical protein Nepgr_017533 [Nepenthes gracilis]|uniref:Uncharacterized protein n=1 Tax=Nepenthes gracilis TaxID=150966 RepID=A0AAD3SSI7_NEPGR|nr:hypothetical protein Nepgr_017533 [Nepenthes gracilis]